MLQESAPAVAAASSYDVVPYQSHAFSQSQPDKLALVAKLFGLDPVLPSRARVLELGCASGGNLIPLAARFPNASFLGIDLSAVEVEHGREQIKALGLTNIRIEQRSITEFSGDERFDYIIAHGVYSWVPPEVQQAIMKLCGTHLSEQGVAYISYNVYPGWKAREVVRDAMMFHAGGHQDPKVKLQQARGFIQYVEKISDPKSAYGTLLREEAKVIGNAPDYYLFHDHLEENNRPCYFKDFIAEASRFGLGFLGEASLAEMAPQRLGKEVFETLNKLSAGNIIATEQYMDFFKNRMFRQTLLVRQPLLSKVRRNMSIERVLPFLASAPVQIAPPATSTPTMSAASSAESAAKPSPTRLLASAVVDQHGGLTPVPMDRAPGSESEIEFQIGPNARIKTSSAVMKAFMNELAAAFPRPVSLAELHKNALAAIGDRSAVSFAVAARPIADPRSELNDLIVRMVIDGLLTLHVEPLQMGRADATAPKAFAVARNLALQKQTRVPNLRHESITLSPVEAEVLALMDGERDRALLIAGIIGKSQSGEIRVERNKQLVQDDDTLRPLVEQLLTQTLIKFERCALLS